MNYYDINEGDNFKIKVGESFKVKLSEQVSAGYSHCWINNKSCLSTSLIKEEYFKKEHLIPFMKVVGENMIIEISFRGVTKGVDTIKLANCPTTALRKNCNEFSEESSRITNTQTNRNNKIKCEQCT